MLRILVTIFLFFTFFSGHTSIPTDTLELSDDLDETHPGSIYLADCDILDIDNLDQYIFSQANNPSTTKKSTILYQLINYAGTGSTKIIIETKGFHYVDVYLKNLSKETTIIKKTGRLAGYPENEMFSTNSKTNKVIFPLEAHTSYELVIHYRNPKKEKIEVGFNISEEHTWYDHLSIRSNATSFWLGIFFGTLILLSLVNFIFYYLFRDGTYIVYVGYILTITLYESVIYGFLDQTPLKYFPKGLFLLNNTSLFLFIIFYFLFLRAFINLKKFYPRWNIIADYLILFLILLAIATDILVVFEQPYRAFYYRNLGLLGFIPIAIIFLINVVFSKRLIDRVFFAGSVFLVFSGLASIITFFGSSGLSDIFLQVGIIIELVIFNIGLGLRSKIIQNEKDHELQTLNASLEEKVRKRTEEVYNINQELTSQRDQLYQQKETIEKNLRELDKVRENLEQTVGQKTKELRQANKELVAQNAQLEQYAFITAHNLKAPVARLKGLINIFEITNPKPNPNSEILNRIKEASLDMDNVISDINKILEIKNFSKQDHKEIDLEELILKIEKRLEDKVHESNVKISKLLKVKTIHSIDTYIESILYNLIYNGIKYKREDIKPTVEIQSYMERRRKVIKVIDNGVGIDLDKYGPKIFGLYQRFHDHVNGKGIGLYLVKTQVEALNGKITISSKVNKGTVFKLSLPSKG